ncbi:DUF2599 domain-containing protein [Nocardia sp. 004]|uniref:DUF2599 domain-containing protein n=1 Tax=Nocardia sp. 004 TaxID=3385978 RepID=UPI0039A01F59
MSESDAEESAGGSTVAQRHRNHLDTWRRAATLLPACLLSLAVACGCAEPDTESAADATAISTTAARDSIIPGRPTAEGALPSSTAPAVDPYADLPLIDHVTWVDTIDGPRLLVFPTPAGRQTTFPGAAERAWQEIRAESTNADTPGMRDQFICHWAWARLVQPNKPSWNLEPWRPAVGYPATVEAGCNPGGPER